MWFSPLGEPLFFAFGGGRGRKEEIKVSFFIYPTLCGVCIYLTVRCISFTAVIINYLIFLLSSLFCMCVCGFFFYIVYTDMDVCVKGEGVYVIEIDAI